MENPANSQTTLNLLQVRMLIIGLRFEAKTGMLMTSRNKVDSAKLAKSFLGLPLKSRVPKAELADKLQILLDDAESPNPQLTQRVEEPKLVF